jgi:hypothetical protein
MIAAVGSMTYPARAAASALGSGASASLLGGAPGADLITVCAVVSISGHSLEERIGGADGAATFRGD